MGIINIMGLEIKNSYLDVLNKIKSKRTSYMFPKFCAQLLSNPENAEPILLARVYKEIEKELMAPLELINLTIDDIPSPPPLHPRIEIEGEVVTVTLPFLEKSVISALLKSPGSKYDEESNSIEFPLSASLIPYFRALVKDLELSVAPASAALFKKTIADASPADLALAFLAIKDNKIYLKLRYPFLKLSEKIAKLSSTPEILGSREYYFPLGLKESVLAIINEHNVKTIFSDNFESDTTRFSAFDFSGNINDLSKISILEIKGVKDKRASKFLQYGIKNVVDLLFTFPRKYIDKSNPVLIRNLKEGDDVALIATVASIDMNYARKILKITLQDKTGKIIATFFNSAWLAKKFSQGEQVLVYGKADGWGNAGSRRISLTNPSIEKFESISAAIVPIYPQSQKAGVSSGEIYNATSQVLERIPNLYDEIDKHLENKIGLLSALKKIHKPISMEDVELSYSYLVESELLKLQLFMLLQKEWLSSQKGSSHALFSEEAILKTFPYTLTDAQARVIKEIRIDLADDKPMNRLLQGDVGSGKTMVAAAAVLSLIAANPDKQVALMAPTEILATQLYNDFIDFLNSFTLATGSETISAALFTNKLKPKERVTLQEDLAAGKIQLAVGTHALIADKISFKNLAFVIIDEQHRFGVNQRAALSNKSKDEGNPDLLIMTATPIPRTAALTVFGSVDISTLDELPPGRTPIETLWIKSKPDLTHKNIEPWSKIIEELKLGRQAYVVCPLVEDNEKLELASAEEVFLKLSSEIFNDFKVDLVHGQQKPEERELIMKSYKNGEIDVLVSTTVIEVGVNVPNASTIVILDAERFGISQLHQLRGRVGRGLHASYCYLVSDTQGEQSNKRLEALVESTDGFYLSEIDLQLRGHGQLFGEAQSGMSDLKVANLDEHADGVIAARAKAEQLFIQYSPNDLLPMLSAEKSLDNMFRA